MTMRILILLLFVFLISCGEPQNNSKTKDTSPKVDLTEFYEFYALFHQDTTFQANHITFPLEGKPANDTLVNRAEKFHWQRENWAFHKSIDFEISPYARKITPLGEELVVEYIVHKKLGFGMIRRFAKIGSDWYLIYYAGMNPLMDNPM